MTTNPSPKARFMAVKANLEAHRNLMQRDDLRNSLDFALLEYQNRLRLGIQDQLAATGHFRMTGVLEFIDVLMGLAESRPEPSNIVTPNLNHRA